MKKQSPKLYIVAFNIHEGGGAVLLRSLIRELSSFENLFLVLDPRFEFTPTSDSTLEILRVPSYRRIFSELYLKFRIQATDTVLFMGSLPPLFSIQARVYIYFQNINILTPYVYRFNNFTRNLKKMVQRIWLHNRRHNYKFLVQTRSVRFQLMDFGIDNLIKIFPFYEVGSTIHRSLCQDSLKSEKKKYDFIYVASGEEHKNHKNLLEAWRILAEDGIYPSLCLTIDPEAYPVLCNQIKNLSAKFSLEIENLGLMQHEIVTDFYKMSGALIYPSFSESFGLPLIEARILQMPILASELDYVRELIDPEETFNPKSPFSIALAVKRFLKIYHTNTFINPTEKFIEILSENRAFDGLN